MKALLGYLAGKAQSRVFVYCKGLYFNYRIQWEDWLNPYDKNLPWRIKREWYVALRFSPHLFKIDKLYYDGHYQNSVILLGILLGIGHSYDSRPVVNWDGRER